MFKNYYLFLFLFLFLFLSPIVFAGTLSVDTEEAGMNSIVRIFGRGFTPNANVFLQNNLEPNTAWWDGYNEQWGFPIRVLTNSAGDFNFNWTVPFDFRTSPGKQNFSVGNSFSAAIEWNAGGEYPTSKNKVVCHGGFCYTTSTFSSPNGGVEKFNMETGARACFASVAVSGNDIATDGTHVYTTYATTTSNLRRTLMSDCTGTTAFNLQSANAFAIKIDNGNAFVGFTGTASVRAVLRYNNLTTTPTLVATFQPPARAFTANALCVSPDGNRVFAGYSDGNIFAYDYVTGATYWNVDPDEATATFQVLGLDCDANAVYVAKGFNNTGTAPAPFFGGSVTALNATTGALIWRSERIDNHYVYGQHNKIMCDSVNCYVAIQAPIAGTGTSGISGGPIIQIRKSDGKIGWVKWRSWLPASTADYGTGATHASPIDLWVDSNENGFIYPVYSTGRIQKLHKNDVAVESFPNTNLWIRSNPNLYNFVMNPTKNVFYSNERPTFSFKAMDNTGQYLDTDDNRFNTSFLRFSTINAHNEFTATETASSQFMDPRIMSAYSTTATLPNPTPFNNLKFMFDEDDSGVFCETATYNTKLFGWHINNRYCLYENLDVNNATLRHTQNGVKLASIANYFLVNPKKWDDFPITKTFGTENWAWLSSHNPTFNQILGYATRFGANGDEVWYNQFGQSTSFNTGTGVSIIDYIDASQDFNNLNERQQKWHESYFLFKPLGAGTDGNRHWQHIENDTNMIANPIVVVQGNNQPGSYVIGANTFLNRIDFNATEPGILARTNEPVWFDINFTGGINSNCSDIVVTDITNTPIGLWQLDSESCTVNNFYTLFIQDNFALGELKRYRLYYNSPGNSVLPSGSTDLITSLVSGTCAAGTDIIDVNSTNWYRWVRPGVGADALNTLRFNFGGSSNTWFNHATTRYALNIGYLNSQSTGTGAGSATHTTGTALATFASRCYQRSHTRDRIFTRIDMNTANITVSPHNPIPGNPNNTLSLTRQIVTRWYFFNGNGRIRVMSKLNQPLPVMTTGISQNYKPYILFGMHALIPQGTVTVAANNFVNWSGRKELMDAYQPIVMSPDKKSAILTPSPLPLMFTIDNYRERFPTVASARDKVGSGCTVHKVWPYFHWRPQGPTTLTNATTFATAYTTDFISCHYDLNGSIPDVGNNGYVNAFPKLSIYGTGLNRFVDPNQVAKFYLKPNLFIPDNRENRWLPPLALNAQYGTSAKVSTIILDICPTEEYGYKGYDDFLKDLSNLISSSSTHKVETNRNNIPCATSITIFSTSTGSIGKYFLFQRDVNVVVAEVARPDATYPINLYNPTTGSLSVDGNLDYTAAQRALYYLGKWYFTSSSDPYVISGYATTGAEQLSGAVRYAWAPSFAFNKKAYSETAFWDKNASNLTYYQSPCIWTIGTASPFGDMDAGPGWVKNFSTGQQGTICPRRNENIEQYSSFRPAVASLYPTSALVNTVIDNVMDGRPNKVTTVNDLGIDAALYSRHNSLWDGKHFSNYTQVINDLTELNEGPKHSNVKPWQCDFSRRDSKNFCIVPMTTTTLIFTATPEVLTPSQPWSPYYQSHRETSVIRNHLNNVWFNTAAMFPTFDFVTEKAIFPMLGETEFTFDTLYTSNNPNDYRDLMDKVFPRLHPALYQNQFLLRDWKNTAFMTLSGGDTREYLRGETINVTGFLMRNSENLRNAPIIVQVFKNSAPTTPLTTHQTVTDANGNFNYSYTITPTAEPGLYFFKAIYNNGEITGTTSYRVSALQISTVLDKQIYVAGDAVVIRTTITDATIGSLINNANTNLRIIGPEGNTLFTTQMINQGRGVYTYSFQLSPSTANGTYIVQITATTANNTGTATIAFGVGDMVSSINIINNFQLSDANKEFITQVTTLQNVVPRPLQEFIINYQLSGGLDLDNIQLFTKDGVTLSKINNIADLNTQTYYISINNQNNPIVYNKANFDASQIRTMVFIARNKYYQDIEKDYNSANNYSSELASYCSILTTPAALSNCANANTYLSQINGYYAQAQTASSVDQFFLIKTNINSRYILFMNILNSLRALATNQASCQIFVPGTWALGSNVSFVVLMNGPSRIPLTGLSFNVNLFNSSSVLVNSYSVTEFGSGWYHRAFSAPTIGGGYNLRIDQNIGTNRFQCSASFDVNQATAIVVGGGAGSGGLTTDQNNTLYLIYFLTLDIASVVNSINSTVNTINTNVNSINTTVNTINSTVNSVSTAVNNIDSNVSIIKTNMATVSDISILGNNIQSLLNYSIDINNTVYATNAHLFNLYYSLIDINSTVNTIRSTATDINNTINSCNNSPQASICGRLSALSTNLTNMTTVLNNVNSIVVGIDSTTTTINQTVNNLNTTTTSIYSTVTDINNTSHIINIQLSAIDNNTQTIYSDILNLQSLLDCSTTPENGVCNRLINLGLVVSNINQMMFDQNSLLQQILSLNTDINLNLNTITNNLQDMNTTINNINSAVNVMNNTINNIDLTISAIASNMATANDIASLDSTLQSILGYVININDSAINSNTQLISLTNTVTEIDTTTAEIYTTTQAIQTMINNCSSAPQGSICSQLSLLFDDLSDMNNTLQTMGSTITNIDSTTATINQTVNNLNTTTTNLYSTVTDINNTSAFILSKVTSIDTDTTHIQSEIQAVQDLLACAGTPPQHSVCDNLQIISSLISDVNISTQNSLLGVFDSLSTLEYNQDAISLSISYILSDLNCNSDVPSSLCSNIQTIISGINSLDSGITGLNSTMNQIGNTLTDINVSTNLTLNEISDLSLDVGYLTTSVLDVNSNILRTQQLISDTSTNLTDLIVYLSQNITDVNLSNNLSLLDIINSLGTIENNQAILDSNLSLIYSELNCVGNPTSPMCSSLQTIINNTSTLETSILDLNNTMQTIGTNVLDINTTTTGVLITIQDMNALDNSIFAGVVDINSNVNGTINLINNVSTNLQDINSTIKDINTIVTDTNTTTGNTSSKVSSISSSISSMGGSLAGMSTSLTNIESTVTDLNQTIIDINTSLNNLSQMMSILEDINDTTNNIYTNQTNQFNVILSDFDRLAPGNTYRAKLWIFDFNGSPLNADTAPIISLYDPARNLIVTNASMELSETGTYIYSFTSTTGQIAGIWEAIVTTTVKGITTSPSDFWELTGNPPEVKIISMIDTTIPTIVADLIITNEGTTSQEYQYEYCIVSDQSNQCGGNDDVDYSSGAKLIHPGQTWNTQLSLNVNTPGTYWFKIRVYYGIEMSASSKQFVATTQTVNPPNVPGGGGGGGGSTSGESATSGVTGFVNLPIDQGKLTIIDQPGEIKVRAGDLEFYVFKIKNTGTGILKNVDFEIQGIPKDWYTIEIEKTELGPNEESAIVIKFRIPDNADLKDRVIEYRINSKTDSIISSGVLRVLEKPEAEIKFYDISVSKIKINGSGEIECILENVGNVDLNLSVSLLIPKDWQIEKDVQEIFIRKGERKTVTFKVTSSYRSGVQSLVLTVKNNSGINFKGTTEDKIFKQILTVVIGESAKTGYIIFPPIINAYVGGALLLAVILFMFHLCKCKKKHKPLGYKKNLFDTILGLK